MNFQKYDEDTPEGVKSAKVSTTIIKIFCHHSRKTPEYETFLYGWSFEVLSSIKNS